MLKQGLVWSIKIPASELNLTLQIIIREFFNNII